MPRTLLRSLAPPVGILLAYFLAPFNAGRAPIGVVAGIVLSVLAVGLVAVVIAREVRRGERRLTGYHLLVALEIVLVTFALLYYLLASSSPGQFVGLRTRLDGLYFATTTITTVGYGDVHPAGQLARGFVTVQLIFNLVFVAAFANLWRDRMAQARSERA